MLWVLGALTAPRAHVDRRARVRIEYCVLCVCVCVCVCVCRLHSQSSRQPCARAARVGCIKQVQDRSGSKHKRSRSTPPNFCWGYTGGRVHADKLGESVVEVCVSWVHGVLPNNNSQSHLECRAITRRRRCAPLKLCNGHMCEAHCRETWQTPIKKRCPERTQRSDVHQ
jgi:hypothetical protein